MTETILKYNGLRFMQSSRKIWVECSLCRLMPLWDKDLQRYTCGDCREVFTTRESFLRPPTRFNLDPWVGIGTSAKSWFSGWMNLGFDLVEVDIAFDSSEDGAKLK